jgi:UrcA family protein
MNPSITSTGLRGLIATAICGLLGLGLCAVATADPGAASRTVKFADLNISNPSGAHVLYMRIRAAAQVVCSYYFFATDTDKAGCVRDATAAAVIKINRPALCAVYNAHNKTLVLSCLASRKHATATEKSSRRRMGRSSWRR